MIYLYSKRYRDISLRILIKNTGIIKLRPLGVFVATYLDNLFRKSEKIIMHFKICCVDMDLKFNQTKVHIKFN